MVRARNLSPERKEFINSILEPSGFGRIVVSLDPEYARKMQRSGSDNRILITFKTISPSLISI